MKKILYLGRPSVVITGGQKYNEDVINVIEKYCDCEIVSKYKPQESYVGCPKFLIPFAELRLLSTIRKCDYVFWGDMLYKYHFLLLLITRIFTKTKCLEIVHHYSFLALKGYQRIFKEVCERTYNSLMHYIIYPNPYIFDMGVKWNSKHKIVYIPTHIHKRVYNDVTPRKYELLYVGTVEHRKGIHLLLQSLNIIKQKFPNIKLNIVGKAAPTIYVNSLKTYVSEQGLTNNINFAGRVSDEELNLYYKSAYIFVFPSLLEGYGLSIVEAMQYGLPVVAFDNSAMPYTIKDGINGYLAEDKNYFQFADKVLAILQNDKLREKMHQGAYHTIEQVKGYEDFREELIKFMSKI